MQDCDLPFSRYSQLNYQNLDLKSLGGTTPGTTPEWKSLGGTTPESGEDRCRTNVYHHAKFHADRCHHRRDICDWTDRYKEDLISDKMLVHTSVA